MEIGKISGQVVSTVRAPEMPHNALLLVDILDKAGQATGQTDIAIDVIGAGEGEIVVLVRGSSARKVVGENAPVDLAIVGIVDQLSSRGKTLFSKTGKE